MPWRSEMLLLLKNKVSTFLNFSGTESILKLSKTYQFYIPPSLLPFSLSLSLSTLYLSISLHFILVRYRSDKFFHQADFKGVHHIGIFPHGLCEADRAIHRTAEHGGVLRFLLWFLVHSLKINYKI